MNLCIAYTSILNGIAVFFGAIIGGIIASLNIQFMNVLLFVFVVSGIVRLIVTCLFFSQIVEVKPVKAGRPFKALLRPLREALMYPFDLISHNHNNGSKSRKERFWPLVNASKDKNS
jgi:MFS family permease